MIWNPKPGQSVELRYAKKKRSMVMYHEYIATVLKASKGPGPKNVLVHIQTIHGAKDWGGVKVVVPRGQLFTT